MVDMDVRFKVGYLGRLRSSLSTTPNIHTSQGDKKRRTCPRSICNGILPPLFRRYVHVKRLFRNEPLLLSRVSHGQAAYLSITRVRCEGYSEDWWI